MENIEFIFKRSKTDGFTIVDNDMLSNKELSMQAKGLMTYLLSQKSNWVIHPKEITKHFANGKEAIYSTFTELMQNDYLCRVDKMEGNLRKEVFYYVFEEPSNCRSFKETGVTDSNFVIFNPNTKIKQILRNPTFRDTDNRDTENPYITSTVLEQELIKTNTHLNNKIEPPIQQTAKNSDFSIEYDSQRAEKANTSDLRECDPEMDYYTSNALECPISEINAITDDNSIEDDTQPKAVSILPKENIAVPSLSSIKEEASLLLKNRLPDMSMNKIKEEIEQSFDWYMGLNKGPINKAIFLCNITENKLKGKKQYSSIKQTAKNSDSTFVWNEQPQPYQGGGRKIDYEAVKEKYKDVELDF